MERIPCSIHRRPEGFSVRDFASSGYWNAHTFKNLIFIYIALITLYDNDLFLVIIKLKIFTGGWIWFHWGGHVEYSFTLFVSYKLLFTEYRQWSGNYLSDIITISLLSWFWSNGEWNHFYLAQNTIHFETKNNAYNFDTNFSKYDKSTVCKNNMPNTGNKKYCK